MKKVIIILGLFSILTIVLFFKSCVINNPEPKECEIINTTITKITEGTSYDIVFHDNGGDRYYINRGFEQGLNLDSLNASVLNKKVTLHLPKLLFGISEHIAQLTVGEEVIFTEFD